jgi:hypothetical protein
LSSAIQSYKNKTDTSTFVKELDPNGPLSKQKKKAPLFPAQQSIGSSLTLTTAHSNPNPRWVQCRSSHRRYEGEEIELEGEFPFDPIHFSVLTSISREAKPEEEGARRSRAAGAGAGGLEDEDVRPVAGILPPGVEAQLALPHGVRHHRLHHH